MSKAKKVTPKLDLGKLATERKAVEAGEANGASVQVWYRIEELSYPGLYVQRTTPNGRSTYEVVRAVIVANGLGALTKIFTPDQSEEHNPLIVCHSTYQAIKE